MSLSIRIQEFLSVRRRAADLRMLKDLVVPSRDVRLLDVGGGAGAATERFAAGCREIVVLEPDPRKVALGRRLRPAIRFDEGRAETIPFPDHSFDRVVAVTAFHHLEDQDRSLTEMRRVSGIRAESSYWNFHRHALRVVWPDGSVAFGTRVTCRSWSPTPSRQSSKPTDFATSRTIPGFACTSSRACGDSLAVTLVG